MMFSLALPLGWDCLIVGISLAKVTMATIAYCMGERTKSIPAFRYRGSVNL
jgi:hypothetical protein